MQHHGNRPRAEWAGHTSGTLFMSPEGQDTVCARCGESGCDDFCPCRLSVFLLPSFSWLFQEAHQWKLTPEAVPTCLPLDLAIAPFCTMEFLFWDVTKQEEVWGYRDTWHCYDLGLHCQVAVQLLHVGVVALSKWVHGMLMMWAVYKYVCFAVICLFILQISLWCKLEFRIEESSRHHFLLFLF